jgi:ethanolamine-phosphate cytidylyltransferase
VKDGAFDLLHYGHMNAFRLARSLGTHLIVGLNSDESISECKGPPLMKDDERLTMVSACKFVDEVIPGCPYVVRFCAVSENEVCPSFLVRPC